jgi:hypothetical protein
MMAEGELEYGIRFDTNYYYFPDNWINDRPGFFTGSGMPMRFADSDGTIIDVYQAATQMTDESGQSYPFTINTLLDKAIGPEKYYGAFTANIHTDGGSQLESDSIIASAIYRNIPVVSARQMLNWIDGRNGSFFHLIDWDGNILSFTVTTGQGANGLQAIVPISNGLEVASITHNGGTIGYNLAVIKGINYAVFYASSGDYQVTMIEDTTPPTIFSNLPIDSALDVSSNATARATFNEAMDAATVESATFELRDALEVLVPATVTYDSSTNTAILTPSTVLDNDTTYTATLFGGAGGVTDAAGNPLETNFGWSFTTAVYGGTTEQFSIWEDTAVPAVISDPDASAVELGVKFRSDSDGYITALRFYKGPSNTGIHVGNLWTASGALLASVTFANETASGWQTQILPVPVAISADMTYVASYHTSVGYYSANGAYFSSSGFNNLPLRALADGEEGGNGVYLYGDGGFPNQTWNAANYWVDVVFLP